MLSLVKQSKLEGRLDGHSSTIRTDFMELSPSWEDGSLQLLKNFPTSGPILGWMNPVHSTSSYMSKIHLNSTTFVHKVPRLISYLSSGKCIIFTDMWPVLCSSFFTGPGSEVYGLWYHCQKEGWAPELVWKRRKGINHCPWRELKRRNSDRDLYKVPIILNKEKGTNMINWSCIL
jgi:hypothetical protein